VGDGTVSASRNDAAQAAAASAMAERDAAQQALDLLIQGTRPEIKQETRARAAAAEANEELLRAGARVEDIEAAQADVTAARARLEQIDVSIGELTIRAPADGRIESLDLRPGDLLSPGAPAAVLLERQQLFVRIYIPETQLGYARVGQTVPIFVDSFPDRPFTGTIVHINDVGEYTPRNLQTADERAHHLFGARVDISAGRDVLRAGMAAYIRVKR
jgi:HlyD family secretion protein